MEGQFSAESETRTLEIESHLSNNAYLSGGPLPGAQDSVVFFSLKGAPDATKYPHFFHWFATLSIFNPAVVKTWGVAKKEQPQKGGAKQGKPEGAKPEGAKEAKKDDDDDLFGDDDEATKAADAERLAKRKAEEDAKKNAKKKEAVIAKSIVLFDVKIIEEEQDLDALAKKILDTIKMDGLHWKTEYKKVPVAYNIKKLQMGCTIEDDKVLTDDIFDKILEWEDEVQSVDVVSFQKV
jgi:translation elongation factor EF-1beta